MNKKRFSTRVARMAIFGVFAWQSIGVSHADLVDVNDYQAKVTAGALNVRSGPSSSTTAITYLLQDTVVTVTHNDGAWRRVIYNGGSTGYMYGQYLQQISGGGNPVFPGNGDLNIADYNARLTVSGLNVRSGPGTQHSILGAVFQDREVNVTHRNGDWLRIAWGSGVPAYIYGPYTEKVVAPQPQAPSSCSARDFLPAHQFYDNALAEIQQGSGLEFSIQRDPAQGVVVINAWIRGPQRQALYQSDKSWNPVKFVGTEVDSDRGASRFAHAGDSRALVVLDYLSGNGWIVVQSTTFKAELRRLPDFSKTTDAYPVNFDYATRQPTWIWEDGVEDTRRRFRVHLTAAPPTAGVFDGLQAALTPSVDFQILVDRNTDNSFGITQFQGDTFPNVSVYRYRGCNGVWQKAADKRHVRSADGWKNMAKQRNWWYDSKHPRWR